MYEKSASDEQARQKTAKRRSLREVNEHFELIFNAVWSSVGSFRTKPKQKAPEYSGAMEPVANCEHFELEAVHHHSLQAYGIAFFAIHDFTAVQSGFDTVSDAFDR
ncbi:hypothetical protein GCM10027040_10130 [Halomonas shantousis]